MAILSKKPRYKDGVKTKPILSVPASPGRKIKKPGK